MKNHDNNIHNKRIGRFVVFAVSAVIAVALALTGALCLTQSKGVTLPDISSGSVQPSATNRGAITGTTAVANIKSGTYVAGDYFEYGYSGSVVSVQLVPGKYKLEVWGGAGGGLAAAGGKGGYATGTYTITSTSYLYICVGNVGTNSQNSIDGSTDYSYAGGYNGGGAGSGRAGPGGGGATHIATSSFTASSYSSKLNDLLVVAGGGGGGNSATYTEVYGTGSGGSNTPYTSYGVGQSGCHSKHNGSYLNDEGGGGGGYRGGGVRHGDDTKASYAGQNYVKSGLESASNSYGQRASSGLARITIVSFTNSAPTTKSLALTGKTLGATTQTINANQIGQDPDAATNTNGSATTVYFQTQQLYLDSACTTTVASAGYFSYSFSNSSTFSISSYNKLPRSGTNGQANNKITVYCKIKDNFTQSVATSTLSFTISFNGVSTAHNTNTTGVATGTGNANKYRYGKATTTDVNQAANGALYGSAVNAWTVTVQKPIKIGDYVSIDIAKLMTNPNTSYYAVYFVPTSTMGAAYNYTGSTTATIYDFSSGSTYASKTGYSVLKINGINPSASWQRITGTLYLVEKSSVGATNREPTTVSYDSQSVEINFRVDNTRPVLSGNSGVVNVGVGGNATISMATLLTDADETITASTHSIKEVKVPAKEFVQLDKYNNVVSAVQKSGAAANISYYNIKGAYAGANTSGMSDVTTGFDPKIASTGVTSDAFVKYSFTGITLTLTGLRPSYSLYKSDRIGKGAYTGGTMAAPSGTATVQNPGHFYLLVRIQDNNDTADTGIWRPVAVTVGGSAFNTAPVNTGTSTGSVSLQGTVANLPTIEGSANDNKEYLFAPMAINVGGTQHIIGSYKNASGTLTQDGLQPLALDADNFSTSTGIASWSGKFNEFLTLNSTAAQVVQSINASEGGKYIEASLFDLYVSASYFGGRVRVGTGSVAGVKYITLENSDVSGYYKFSGLKIKLKNSTLNRYFQATVNVKDTSGASVATHIAIRIKNSMLTANTADKVATYSLNEDAYSTYENSGTPTLKYRVPLNSRFFVTPYDIISDYNMSQESGNNVFTPFTLNGMNGSLTGSTFTVGGTSGTEIISPLFSTAATADYRTDQYKTNIKNMLAAVNGSTPIGRLSNGKTFATSAAAGNVYHDRLFFARSSDPTGASADPFTYNPAGTGFNVSSSALNGYINLVQGNTVNIDGKNYALDFLFFKAITRTVQPGIVTLTVRDRSGNSVDGNSTITVRIEIEVVNTAPIVNDPSAAELKTGADDGAIMNSVADIYINNVMSDADGDTLYLIMNRGLMVATTDGITVADLKDASGNISFDNIDQRYLKDAYGNLLTNSYVTAQMLSADAFTVRALGSTKNIEGGVFVYFFVTDNRGGETLGYKQIEVVNTSPTLNIGDGGFDGKGNLWNIDVARAFDITRDRYIVGSEEAKRLLKANHAAVDADIKLIATDADALSGVLLSPRAGDDYVRLNTAAPDYAEAVPNYSVATSFSGRLNSATAVILFSKTGAHDAVAEIPSDYFVEMLFFIDGATYTRAQLITALQNDTAGVRAACFDAEGRWILTDFAVRLRATQGFVSGTNIGVTLSVADESKYGGDTAGIATAYASARKDASGNYRREAVNGRVLFTVYQHIGQTGIITKDDFAAYDNYYVVDVPTGSTGTGDDKVISYEQYVTTYDGNVDSVYPAGQPTLYYADVNGKLVLSSTGTADTLIKAGEGNADDTKAGVHSGTPYASWNSVTLDTASGESAFRYTDTIIVPSTKTGDTFDTVYVPMSFFGMLSGDTIATADSNGNVKYSDNYVTFDTRTQNDNVNVDESATSVIASAITLTDGNGGEWTGNTLANNPYINISAIGARTATNGASYFGQNYSRPYYNRAISVASVDDTGELEDYIIQADKANHNSYVGDGKVLYLEQQETKLKEHNFGLSFTKKNMRTGATNLTLTVKLVKAKDGRTAYETEADAKTVSVEIRIDNSKIDLVAGTGDGMQDNDILHDGETYYVDVDMPTAASRAFMLVRKGSREGEGISEDTGRLYYTDEDYDAAENDSSKFRDYAYFGSETVNKLSSWKTDNTRPRQTDGGKTTLLNVNPSSNNISSIENFYGVSDIAGIADKATDYQPNGGKYGTNNGTAGSGAEGFSSYFSLSYADNGRTVNIMASRKTTINKAELEKIKGKPYSQLTEQDVRDAYAERGLVAETVIESGEVKIARVYYPLKIMIYDDCGAGWNEASYTAIEFRITVTNATPKYRSGIGDVNNTEGEHKGELEYHFSLAVNGSTTFNLYDFVEDADIYATGSGMYRHLATQQDLLDASDPVIRETGDYLKSPLSYTNLEEAGTAQDRLLAGTAGFSERYSKDADVIMWMNLAQGSSFGHDATVANNEIGFTVNRRTTLSNGNPVNSFRFKLYFADNNDTADELSRTGYITFVVNIINQSPRISTNVNSVTMRAGDSLTVMTAYYDKFVGGENYTATPEFKEQSGADIADHDGYLPTNHGTTAYKYSRTRSSWNSRSSVDHTAFSSRNYHELVSTHPDCGDNNIIRDTTSQAGRDVFMGYLGLAEDDTPWAMRIDSVNTDRGRITVQNHDNVKYENSNVLRPVAVTLTAVSACTNQAVTFTVSDGEDTAVYTLYVTVVSAPPVARDANNVDDRLSLAGAHLEGVQENGSYKEATYRTFIIPSADKDVDITGIGAKRAYNSTTVTMQSVATDPDGVTETANMALYNGGMFNLNGNAMTCVNGTYTSEYFNITVAADGRSFTIKCKGYNPESPYEVLTFMIGDSGNNVRENALTVTVHVYTVHSDMSNPDAAALTGAALDAYFAGSEKVRVKSYDEYFGIGEFADTEVVGEPTRFAFVDLEGNEGTDGNNKNPVVDADSSLHGSTMYSARIFAFIEDDGAPIEADVSEWFDVSSRTGVFKLKDEHTTSSSSVYNNYLIGGVLNNGDTTVNLAPSSAARLNVVNRYVNFTMASDGTNISFVPVAATFDKKILLYIEVEKHLGTGNVRNDGILRAGALFTLDVEDSAPRSTRTANENGFEFDGKKGDAITYNIFDPRQNSVSLFTDSDADDEITLVFDPTDEQSYTRALRTALEQDPDLDWAANVASKKDRAFDISVSGSDVTIKINRRMDKLVNGKYAESVTFPLVLTGRDKGGKECDVTVSVTVRNSPLSARDDVYTAFDPETRVGFEFRPTASADGGDDYDCTIEARVLQNGTLTVNIADFLTDPDYVRGGDSDSYMFVGFVKDTRLYNTLIKDPVTAINIGDSSTGEAEDVALVSALFDDDWHFTGFTVKSLSTKRELTGTVYLRIVDRSCDSDVPENGITVRVDITVMNDRPFVKDGMSATTLTLIGTESEIGSNNDPSKTFSIADFVDDNNDTDVVGEESSRYPSTYLRIYSLSYLNTETIYSTSDPDKDIGDSGLAYDSSELFTVIVDIQNYNQLFTITPRQGFYGKGAIEITVVDGDKSTDAFALDVTFRINVEVVYDPQDIKSLKSVTTHRGKNVTLSVDSIIPDIQSTISADGTENPSFNPSSAYILTALEFTAGVSDYLDKVGSGLENGVCVLRAKKLTELSGARINVRYALKSDPTNEFSGFFYIHIAENLKPSIKYESLTFLRNDSGSDDPLRVLDTTQTIHLRPDQLLTDPENDIMRFVSVSSQKPSLVNVSLNDDKTLMSITFRGKGSAKITMVVIDETGEECTRTFIAKNEDLPNPDAWVSIAASFEGNKLIWAIVICLILLLLIIMILLISRSIKRKHDQEELEALLVSEMAIEDQMAKLAAGPAPTDYMSYGFIPPSDVPVSNNIGPAVPPIDPSTALGQGQGAPAPENIALNPGTESGDPDNGQM